MDVIYPNKKERGKWLDEIWNRTPFQIFSHYKTILTIYIHLHAVTHEKNLNIKTSMPKTGGFSSSSISFVNAEKPWHRKCISDCYVSCYCFVSISSTFESHPAIVLSSLGESFHTGFTDGRTACSEKKYLVNTTLENTLQLHLRIC